MAEKIILEVDVAGLANDIQTARVALDSYRIALERSVEENGKFSKEATIAKAQFDAQNKAVKQLEGQLLRVTQAQQANNAILKDLVKQGYDPATKSVDQNRKVLNALTAEYNRASKEGREKLAPAIKQISDELKKQEGAIGDTRRNVGNYKEAITSAFGELKGFGGQIVAVGQNIGGAVNAFKAAEGGVKGFGAALATTGLPLIIMGVNALTEAFSSFKPVADAVESSVLAVKNAFGAFFSGQNIGEAVRVGNELLEVMRDLEDTQNAFNISLEEGRGKTERLIIQSKDRTKTEKERLSALKEAERLEKELYDKQVDRLDSLLEKQQADLLLKTGLSVKELEILATVDDANNSAFQSAINKAEASTRFNEKELIKYQETILERQRLDNESNKFLERAVNARNKIIEKREADELKATEERIKREEAAAKKEIELAKKKEELLQKTFTNERTIRAAEIELLKDGLDKRLQAFDLAFEKEEEALRAAGATEVLITELRNARIAQITKDFYANQTKGTEGFIENRKAQLEQAERDLIESADRAAQELGARQTAQLSNILGTFGSIFGEAASLVTQFADQNVQELQKQYEQGLINEAEFNVQSRELKLKAFKDAKALKVTEAIITTATSTLNAFNSGLQLGGPFGLVLGAVFAAAAAGLGAAQIALISRQQPPKYELGGEVTVGGKLHSEGGTKYVGEDGNRFEVERGEKIFVLNRKASRHIDALGGLNMAFGGRSWSDSPIRYAADGGMIQDGGFGIRQTSEQANTTAMLKQFAKSIVSEMPTPVVSVVEFERVQTDRNKSISVADL